MAGARREVPEGLDHNLDYISVLPLGCLRSNDEVEDAFPAPFHMDAGGRLRLGDLRMHQHTPFAEIAAKHETIIFVNGDEMVRGELVRDPGHGWMGQVDWSTQDVWASYPPAVAARG